MVIKVAGNNYPIPYFSGSAVIYGTSRGTRKVATLDTYSYAGIYEYILYVVVKYVCAYMKLALP